MSEPITVSMLPESQVRELAKMGMEEIDKNLAEIVSAWNDRDVMYLHNLAEVTTGLTTELMALAVILNDPKLFERRGGVQVGQDQKECHDKPVKGGLVSGASLDFPDALRAMIDGRKVGNSHWPDKEMYLAIQVPDKLSKMGFPYVYIYIPVNDPLCPAKMVPWSPSQLDMLSNDWVVLPD